MDVEVEPLRINQSDLTTKRMMDLMAVSPDNGPMPSTYMLSIAYYINCASNNKNPKSLSTMPNSRNKL